MGDKITEVALTDFGKAATIEIGKNLTTVVDGDGNFEKIEETIDKLKNEIREIDDLHVAQRLQDRITRLSSGVAIIRVGASSEVEMIEKKHRIEDALEAVRSAQSEGVVPGGGVMFLKASQILSPNFENEEQASALNIFKRALEAPFRTMATNSGMSPDVTMWMIKDKELETGIDFYSGSSKNLIQSGIIDPAKVTRCALKNAVSVAGTLLLTNHSIVDS
tara:strand:- start:2370 stop:3029 length:660 start_codon:yes stop_codon:yes gene_type:complete